MTDTNIDEILAQRGKTYGDFSDNAKIAQGTKEIIHSVSGWDKLRPYQQEALDMILSKVSRIVTGDPEYVDSWDDIAGYAKLVAGKMWEEGPQHDIGDKGLAVLHDLASRMGIGPVPYRKPIPPVGAFTEELEKTYND